MLTVLTATIALAVGVLTRPADTAADRVAKVVLVRPGDKVEFPAIGWECSFGGKTGLTCAPGKLDTSAQGQPVVGIQISGVVIVGGGTAREGSLRAPRGTLRVITVAVTR
jgi:hypothetical protein